MGGVLERRLDGLDGFIAGAAGELGAEVKLGPGGIVDMIMERVFVGNAQGPGDGGTPGGGGIKGDLGVPQVSYGGRIKVQFAANRAYDVHS